MKKNVASQIIGAQMVSATDGSAFTSATTVYVTGDGGAQAVGSVGAGACTHEGNGFHTYAPAQAETNYDHIGFTFIGTGAVPATVQVYTQFPQTGDSFARIGATGSGLTSLATQASVDVIDGIVDSILVDTAEIGAAGAGLTVLATAANLATAAGFIDTEVAAIKTKTDFLPSATAGSAGGVFIAGSNAATSITTALTANIIGNVTGNLSGSVGSVTGLTAANLDVAVSTRASQASVDDLPTNAELATALGTADDAVLAILGTPAGASLSADVAAVKAQTAAIEVDTAVIGAAGAGLTALATQASVDTIDGIVDAILVDTAEIGAAGAGLTALASAANLATLSGFVDTEVAAILAAVDTEVAAILADTNELQTDWVNGGRLDLILDARASQTSVDDLPTNAELATALGTADDAVLAQVAVANAVLIKLDDTLEDAGTDGFIFSAVALSQAPTGGTAPTVGQIADEVQTRTIAAVTLVNGLAANVITAAATAADFTTEIQTGLATAVAVADLPTNAELATALSTADDAILAQVALVKAKTDNLPADPADASDIAAATAAIAGYIDTEVGAIKAVTDKLDDTLEDAGTDGFIFSAVALSQAPGAGSAPTAAEIADEVETRTIAAVTLVNGLAANVITAAATAADFTTEIQAGLATAAAVADLPTNAELATALGTADDAVLSAIGALSVPTAVQIADAYLDRDMSLGVDSGSPTVRTPRQALRMLRNKWSFTGSTQTITKEDDATASWTQIVTATAGADPITGTDPAGP